MPSERPKFTTVQFSEGDTFEVILKRLVRIERKKERLESDKSGEYTGALALQRIYDAIVGIRARFYDSGTDGQDTPEASTILKEYLITDGNNLANSLAAAFSKISLEEFLGEDTEDEDRDLLAKVNKAKAQVLTRSGLKLFFGSSDKRHAVQDRIDTKTIDRRVEIEGEEIAELSFEVATGIHNIFLDSKYRDTSRSNPFECMGYYPFNPLPISTGEGHTNLKDLKNSLPIEFSPYCNLDQIIEGLKDLEKKGESLKREEFTRGYSGLELLHNLKSVILKIQHRLSEEGVNIEQIRKELDSICDENGIPTDGNLKGALVGAIGKMSEKELLARENRYEYALYKKISKAISSVAR